MRLLSPDQILNIPLKGTVILLHHLWSHNQDTSRMGNTDSGIPATNAEKS